MSHPTGLLRPRSDFLLETCIVPVDVNQAIIMVYERADVKRGLTHRSFFRYNLSCHLAEVASSSHHVLMILGFTGTCIVLSQPSI